MLRIFIIFFITINVIARTVYITDEVDIPIRSEKTFEDNIIRSAPTGTELKILQIDSDGWTKIKLENTEGWVISRYISNSPPAREELTGLKKTYEANKLISNKQTEELRTLRANIKAISKENKDNKMKAFKALSEKKHIEKTYANALKIEHDNVKLKTENLNLRTKLKLANISNEANIENANRSWFLYGGILVIFSLIIGAIFTKLIVRRR